MESATRPDRLLLDLLALESRAARVEGAFAADPELGRIWRAGAALSEACRSVGLEDIHVLEGDVVHRAYENRATEAETARGTEAVTALLRILRRPGDLVRDTDGVLTRCWRAAAVIDPDGRDAEIGAATAPVARALAEAPTPFLGALRAATAFRIATGSAAPSADRLVFMAAEHALRRAPRRAAGRRGAARPDEGAGQGAEGEGAGALLGHIAAGWILLPSIALSEGGFRAWSPGTRPGLENLMRGLGAELDRTLGQIALLRGWRTQARAAAARRNAKSRLRDVVTLAADEPILTAARLRAALGVSRRAAFTLIDEAAGAGILTCVTPRTRWRVWVRPDMAARLAMRRGRTAGAGQGGVSTSDLTEGVPQDGPGADAADRAGEPAHRDAEALAAREAEALAALDTALARADALLARYAETGTRRKDRPE